MKPLKYSLIILSFLLVHYFSQGQPTCRSATGKGHLMNLYHQWSQGNFNGKNFLNGKSGARMAIFNFFPAKAANYNWNTASSSWDIYDTTLYTYTAPNLITSATRKDNLNNFLTRILNSYDGLNNLIDVSNQNWSSGWVNTFRDTFVVDNYNNIITQLHQNWSGTQWVTAFGGNFLNTYNGAGKILLQIAQSWNGTAWENTSRFTYTYNINNQVTQAIRESWNSISSTWGNTSKTDYMYDVSNINTQTVDYLWNGSVWINDAQIINPAWAVWTGDIATSKPQSYIYQTWSGSAWVNNEQLLNATYDSFGGSAETYQLFVSGNWVNENRYSIFYDMQYNQTGERIETWNVPVTAWDTTYEFRYLYTYDGNNSMTQSIYQEYDGIAHAYLNYFKTDYSDFLLLSVPLINTSETSSVQLFPNPVTDFADVIIAPEDFDPLLYQVYNVQGQLIAAVQIGEKHFRLNKNNFAPGVYWLLISYVSGETSSLKFVVQ